MDTTTDTDPFGAVAAESIEHLNEHHDDTVAFMARILCGHSDLASAALTGVDHDGVGVSIVTGAGETVAERFTFAARAATSDDALREFMALLATARASSNEPGATSLEGEFRGAIPTHITTVVSTAEITPRMRQVTVQGGLERFESLAPDQFVYVLAPPHGRRELSVDESFTWEQYEQMPEHERPVGAYYTVRRWHPEQRSLDLWVVLHGHGGDGERWGRTASPGDPVALWGPRQAYEPPPGADSVVLFGDETAIPAIAAILEQLSVDHRAVVRMAVTDPTAEVELTTPATIDLAWETVAASEQHPLFRLASSLDPTVFEGATYVWGGGESHDMSAIRRYVRDVIGISRESASLTGYWRSATS